MMQIGAYEFCRYQEISDSKVGQVREGFGSILSTLTNTEKSLPENEKSRWEWKMFRVNSFH